MKITARKVLSTFFTLQQQLHNPRSPIGNQLDRAKNEVDPSCSPKANHVENLNIALVDLSLLLTGLTEEEKQVCALRYGPSGQVIPYQNMVSEQAIKRVQFEDGSAEMITKAGETLISSSTPLSGFVQVTGWKRRCLTYREIAEKLSLSFQEVRKLDRNACEKVREALKRR